MMRVLPAVFFLFAAAPFHAALAQDGAADDRDARPRAENADKVRRLEAGLQTLRDETHAEMEGVHHRLDDANLHLNRVLLIFAASGLLVLLLAAHNIRLRQRAANQRIDKAVREYQTLARDMRKQLAAPEMQHLRAAQFLRELMRRLRENTDAKLSEAHMRMIREAAADMHIPAALHFIAVALRHEQDDEWKKAADALARLREMDPDDPDILLHLAHVHGKLAAQEPDPKNRALNRRLAQQYYTRFTMALRAMEMDEPPSPVRRTYIQIPQIPPAPPRAKPLEFEQPPAHPEAPPPPPTIETVPAPPPPPTIETVPAPPPPPTIETVPAPPPVVAAPTPPPVVESAPSTPPEPTPPPVQPTPPPEPPPSIEPISIPTPSRKKPRFEPPPEPLPPMRSATPGFVAPAAPAAPVSRRKPKADDAAAGGMIAEETPTKKTRKFRPRVPFNPAAALEKSAAVSAAVLKRAAPAAMKMRDGFDKLTGALTPKEEVLPPLPAPEPTVIPPEAVGPAALMWRAIRAGDQAMNEALTARTLRERNRKIDQAIGLYAEAQSHKTNDVLYFNWGLALLGKALNTPDKKRAVFMNAAVDKFMAGNVVRPGAFDFHLASLYALMGDGENCRKWLQACADKDTLNSDALQAPDFDAVRAHPWFRDFETQLPPAPTPTPPTQPAQPSA